MSESTPVSLGRYVIQGEIGRGMMGAVYRGADPDLGRTVALKTVRLAFAVSEREREQFEKRFLAEARAAAQLSHPGIVVVHDVGRDPETRTLFIALEFLEGRTLEHLVAEGPLEWREAARVAARIAEALHHAHSRGIVHRDVKPANIMILPSGEPKIMDFGIAKLPASNLTMAGQFFGTPAYMSPEQALGGELDGRSDLFSLGAILYQMLVGARAFTGSSVPGIVAAVQSKDPPAPSSVVAAIPEGLDYVVARALSKSPDDRYRDGTSLAEDLEDVRAGVAPRHRAGWVAPARADMTVVAQQGMALPPPIVAKVGERMAARGSVPPAAAQGARLAPRTLGPSVRGPVAIGGRRAASPRRRWPVVTGVVLLAACAAVAVGFGVMRWRGGPRPAEVEGVAAATRGTGPDLRGSVPPPPIETPEPTPEPVVEPAGTAGKAWPRFPLFGKPAGLVIGVEHSLKSGRLRAWVDRDLVLDQRLHARVTRQILVYKSRKGGLSRTLEVEPGEHVVRVQVDAGEATLADQVSARFEGGVTLHLQVDVGGLLKKRLTLSWG